MSYLALARKWRPTTFEEVVGQQHVLSAIGNALDNNKLHHAYLFSGTRGVGKTTIGRIFAKGLNCETGVTGSPCGQCATCKEIDEGRFVDLLEIDAASRTKVEDTREILDNVQYKPARGRYKVYLIDEVHMLSRHSFNALLKTLEEPPEYVKFLLATTDPQKLPVTILSRCLQFHLKPHRLEDIAAQLEHILTQEQVEFDSKAISQLAHAGDGSLRDALSLTDQAIALGNGKVESDTVHTMLGTIDANHALHLIRAVVGGEAKALFDTLDSVAALGVDWDGLLKQIAEHLHKIAMYQVLPTSLDQADPQTAILSALAQQLQPETVQLYYEIAIKGRESLALAPRPQQGVEMVLLRLLAFKPKAKQAISLSLDAGGDAAQQAAMPTPNATEKPVAQAMASRPQATTAAPTPRSSQAARAVPSRQAPQAVAPEAATKPTQQPPAATQQEQQMLDSQPEYPSEDDYQPMSYDDFSPVVPGGNTVQRAPRTAPSAQAEARPAPSAGTPQTPLTGLRHQLRSKRMQANQQPATGDSRAKKPVKADSKTSVLDRLVDKAAPAAPRSQPSALQNQANPVSPDAQSPLAKARQQAAKQAPANEPYQWRPSKPAVSERVERELAVTPALLKQALKHERTPEMAQKLQQQATSQDEWSKLISTLTIPKMVEQLALNSHCEQQGNNLTLTLRPSQTHLNSAKAIELLTAAISEQRGEPVSILVQNGETGQSPLELKDSLYQQKLSDAFSALQGDDHIQFLQNRFGAELEEESVRPI